MGMTEMKLHVVFCFALDIDHDHIVAWHDIKLHFIASWRLGIHITLWALSSLTDKES